VADVKVQEKLDEIMALVAAARTLPMSSSIVVNKAELTRLLTELGELLPDDLAQAEAILIRRDAMLYEATANAERLLTAAIEERRRMVSEEEVLRQARIEAAELIQDAQERSERTSREIDEYVDAKLAHLEVSVTNILETIRQGRERLAEPGLYRELAAPAPIDRAPEPRPLPRRTRTSEGGGALEPGDLGEWGPQPEWRAAPDWDGPRQRTDLPRRQSALGTSPAADGVELPAGGSEPAHEVSTPEATAAATGPAPEGGWTPQRPEPASTDEGTREAAGQLDDAAPAEADVPESPGAPENESAEQDEPAPDTRPQEARAD
jgi:hypothetical protein